MFKKFYEFFLFAITISERVQKHDRAIENIERDFRELLLVVRDFQVDLQQMHEKQAHARQDQTREFENLQLRLENEMLKFERRLNSPKNGD